MKQEIARYIETRGGISELADEEKRVLVEMGEESLGKTFVDLVKAGAKHAKAKITGSMTSPNKPQLKKGKPTPWKTLVKRADQHYKLKRQFTLEDVQDVLWHAGLFAMEFSNAGMKAYASLIKKDEKEILMLLGKKDYASAKRLTLYDGLLNTMRSGLDAYLKKSKS